MFPLADSQWGKRRVDSRARAAVMTWLTPSKKKNFETTKVLTSMTTLAAMTARREMMLRTRITFKTMYPGPAMGSPDLPERLKQGILVVVGVQMRDGGRREHSTL